jgi:hypothetical protein
MEAPDRSGAVQVSGARFDRMYVGPFADLHPGGLLFAALVVGAYNLWRARQKRSKPR